MEVLQGQIFTPNKKTILADEIKIELENLNKAIAKGGIDAGQKQAIDSSKLALQKVLTSILTKRGVVTPDETDDALKKIDEAKKARLKNDFYGSIKKYGLYIAIAVAAGVGLYYYTKKSAK
jgi:hypothetical protein